MGERAQTKQAPKISIFLCLFVLLLGAEGQLFESLFSKRSSQDGEQSDFVEDTSKQFLSLLFTPFSSNQRNDGGVGGGREAVSGLFSSDRSGPYGYDNYRDSASSKHSSSAYSSYNQGYPCEGCSGNESPPPPSRQVSSEKSADYTCSGCDKYPTQPKPPPAFVDYSCKGCSERSYKSSSKLQDYHSDSTTFNENYQAPKVFHEVIGYHKQPKYSVVDTRLRIPPVKFRLHINPKITITTNTQDPLTKMHHHHDDDDYIPPPEIHPHPHHIPPLEIHPHSHHHHSFGHGFHHLHTARRSHEHHSHHHQQPYGAHITKHEQPIINKYERSFAIKINPEIRTDPPPTRPTTTRRPTTTTRATTTTTTTTSRSPRLQSSPSRAAEISPRIQSLRPTAEITTTTTTSTSAPSVSADARSSIDGLREAVEAGRSPLEVLLQRRRSSTTTTTTTQKPTTTTEQPTTDSKTTTHQREIEETTEKKTTFTEAASSNEVESQNTLAVTTVQKIMEATTPRPTQDPKVMLSKLREAADAGLNPLEVLLSRRNASERRLIPRKAEGN